MQDFGVKYFDKFNSGVPQGSVLCTPLLTSHQGRLNSGGLK